MKNRLATIIKHFAERPKVLFLIDSLGAALTTFFISVVLVNLNEYVGMPAEILIGLSIMAFSLFIYSGSCFLFAKSRWPSLITIISIANFSYCILTLVLMMYYLNELKIPGLIYFLGELFIICILGYIELSVAKEIRKRELASQLIK